MTNSNQQNSHCSTHYSMGGEYIVNNSQYYLLLLPYYSLFKHGAQPETMEKGSGMKLPLLVGGIFSSAMGSAGHSVPHCCGRQSQGCSQKSLGCDVLGSSKTKDCKASWKAVGNPRAKSFNDNGNNLWVKNEEGSNGFKWIQMGHVSMKTDNSEQEKDRTG